MIATTVFVILGIACTGGAVFTARRGAEGPTIVCACCAAANFFQAAIWAVQ